MEERSRSVGRVIAILDQLSVSPLPMSNLELATALDVPVSSMHRLLRKLTTLGFVNFDVDTACYSVAPRLCELGVRLAEAGGYSQPLRDMMGEIRDKTGYTVSVWVPSGAHVRISALLVGKTRGLTSRLPGELADPFSTPGLAIAPQYSDEELRKLAAMARRHKVPLGWGFSRIDQIRSAVKQVAKRGYLVRFNVRGDGWGMAAWPIPVTMDPPRPGCLAVGALVPELRRRQDYVVNLVSGLRETYMRKIGTPKRAAPPVGANRPGIAW
ncbi:helix-turn-helix domain-containing protein [Candidatus Foliamicus sp.]